MLRVSLGDGRAPDDDVVSFGSDGSRRSTTWQLIGGAVACLVVGFLAGGQTDLSDNGSAEDDSASSVPVVAGAIRNVTEAEDGAEFELSVFNSGDVEAEVSLVHLGGWDATLQDVSTPSIPAGTWRHVRFSAPADCTNLLPANLGDVGLRVQSTGQQYEVDVPVVEVRSLKEYHDAFCAGLPIDRDQLSGVWIVEKTYGSLTLLEGIHLMRFTANGTYAVDFTGGLFSRNPIFYGEYHLNGAFLSVTSKGGREYVDNDDCHRETMRATIGADGRLSLAWVRGDCPDDPGIGSAWILRRVLRDVGLPAPQKTEVVGR